MALNETVRTIQAHKVRVKVFVDFWNLKINAQKIIDRFAIELDWKKFKDVIVEYAKGSGFDKNIIEFAGCYVFGSYSKSNSREYKMIQDTLKQFGHEEGLFFNFSERVKKETTNTCQSCGSKLKYFAESGVDLRISLEMIRGCSSGDVDYMILVSSDRDFIPLLEYLRDLGKRVIHIATGVLDPEMSRISWSQFTLADQYFRFLKIVGNEYLLFTADGAEELVEEILGPNKEAADNVEIINLFDRKAVSDKDLDFLIKNLRIHWRVVGNKRLSFFDFRVASKSISEFRSDFRKSTIEIDLPVLVYRGKPIIAYSSQGSHRWIRTMGAEGLDKWKHLFVDS